MQSRVDLRNAVYGIEKQMDIKYLVAFFLAGGVCSVMVILQYGLRRFFTGNHPIQAFVGVFMIGGIGGLIFAHLRPFPSSSFLSAQVPFFKIAEWTAYVFSIVLAATLLWAVWQALLTYRLYKRLPIWEIFYTLGNTLKGKNAWILFLPIITVLVFCVVLPLRNVDYPRIILLPVILLHLNVLALYGTPPSILLLGSSSWKSVRFFNFIERGIYPYRVIVLLDPSRTEPQRHSRHHWMHFEVDNMRILGSHSWKDVVHRIASSVPVVVLDTRIATPAVVDETRLMLKEPFRFKTLFVVAKDGRAPSMHAAKPNFSSSKLRIVRPSGIVQSLRDMGLTKITSPNSNPILSQASKALNSKRLEMGMMAVARTETAFDFALNTKEQTHGRSALLSAARKLQNELQVSPDDGALGAIAELDTDIAKMEAFIIQWRQVAASGDHDVISSAIAVHHALCNLHQTIDNAPPVFLKRNEEII